MNPSWSNVRIAQPDDAAGVTALLEATYPVSFSGCCSPEVLAVALPLMTRANPQLLLSGTFYVVNDPSGRILGCGGWTREQPGTQVTETGWAYIRHFATHPDHARRGIGHAIMTRCLDCARINGFKHMECFSSPVAEAFYFAMDFISVRRLNLPLGEQHKVGGHWKRVFADSRLRCL